jgi:nicotinate-nucleotide adenylyltransferase
LNNTNKKKIGFFGGGFDPIHFGHLHLAIDLMECHHLDEVIFCPASCSPLKKDNPPRESSEHRLNMCRLAIDSIPFFSLSDIEIERGSSYTIDSIKKLQENPQYNKAKLFLLLSDDALAHLDKWKEILSLLQIATPLIGRRKGDKDVLHQIPRKLSTLVEPGITQTAIIQISSTAIRDRLKKGLYCGHLLPEKVLDYIHKNQLYGA